MSRTVIIIPSRLQAKRLPEKPLKIIKGKEMILHVLNLAIKSGVGEVVVATPENTATEQTNPIYTNLYHHTPSRSLAFAYTDLIV